MNSDNNNTNKGVLYLIPCPIVIEKTESLSAESLTILHRLNHFIVERAKTARHFIKSSGHPESISNLTIHEITTDHAKNDEFLAVLLSGISVGVISEAGCPGVADPGAEMVAWAHKNHVKVVPLVGPSSILLALMGSGFSGQSFAFNGYLSNKKPQITTDLKALEQKARKLKQTQLFMETPYRNGFLIEACLSALEENTMLCIACNINADDETIITQSIKNWKKTDFTSYHKKPTIFIIG